MFINLLHDGTQVHGLLDDLIVVKYLLCSVCVIFAT